MSKLTQTQLIETITQQFADDIPRSKVEAIVKGTFSVVNDAVAEGKRVTIQNFGTFSQHVSKAGARRNPRTGEEIQVPSKQYPKFKASTNNRRVVS